MNEEFGNQLPVNVCPCQFMAWVESVVKLLETAPCLTAAGSVWVISIKTFASLNVIHKTVKEIPDVGTFSSAAR